MTANMINKTDFLIVTEKGGEMVSPAQLKRFYQRYALAGQYCQGKDVLEMACGTGPGLGYLQSISASLIACDISDSVLRLAQEHYQNRIDIRKLDAVNTGLPDSAFDVVILFEAIYYIPDIDSLFREVHRLLRPSGVFLIATANKDLFDFNPSPFSCNYYNPPELSRLLSEKGFVCEFSGGDAVESVGIKSKLIRALKTLAVKFDLIPGSMASKRILKRLFFGPLVEMPAELMSEDIRYQAPLLLDGMQVDLIHQVIYCVATRK
jgi:SAM-dependent methyltransferase